MKTWILRCSLALLLLSPVLTYAQAAYEVKLTDAQLLDDRVVNFKMRVTNTATGQDVPPLETGEIAIYQDGQLLTDSQLVMNAITTDATHDISHTIPFDSQNVLRASGATIGLVTDLSVALGDPFIGEVRAAAESWINLGNSVSPNDPESIGLFIPRSSNSQSTRPGGAPEFDRDHNRVIGVLRTEAPRDGATNLYGAVLEAVTATAAEAKKRGTDSYVIVFGDGSVTPDSAGLFSQIVDIANKNNTIIIAVGIGKPENLDKATNQLPNLASSTNGRYVAGGADVRPINMEQAYKALVKPVNRTGYDVAFVHTAPRDDKQHTFQVKVTIDGRTWESSTLPIPTEVSTTTSEFIPLSQIQKDYMLRGIPAAIILAAVTTALATATRRRPTRIEPGAGK
ncbi:hypothetical protein [Herpetosiphon llansteffanensis]|uniref:hypothetical protein n=1 Tax=Herpetosiphon llansteffanensis TaxID=2094568 RepID=UPI000D7BBA30|nr:hypothetical protein [Herpetosiphon llansteffanensis]